MCTLGKVLKVGRWPGGVRRRTSRAHVIDLTLGPPRAGRPAGRARAPAGPGPLATPLKYAPALVAALHPTMRRIDSEAHVRVAYAR